MKKALFALPLLFCVSCMTTTTNISTQISGNEKKAEGYKFFGAFGDDVYNIATKNNIKNVKLVETDNILGIVRKTTVYGN